MATNYSARDKVTQRFQLKAHTNGHQITYISLCTYINALFDIYILNGVESISEANRFSAGQGIPLILCNPNVQYQAYNCPPPVPILSQINPFHVPLPHILNIHFNIILPSNPVSSKWSISFMSPPPKPCIHLSSLPYMTYTQPISFFFI